MGKTASRTILKYSIEFGQKVRELRDARNLSQEQLAELAGLHRTFIGAVERGEQSISLDNAGRIAAALRVTIGSLIEVRREEWVRDD